MPASLPTSAKPGHVYDVRKYFRGHELDGSQLWAWDTESDNYGLCNPQKDGLAKQTVGANETLLWCIETPPATMFTIAVSYLASSPQGVAQGQVPNIRFQLLAGHGRAASRVLHLDWQPTDWLAGGLQAWVAQYTGRLCSSWWLYAQTTVPQGAAPQAEIVVKALIARGTATNQNPLELGPGVTVVP
jgi:hypothetical protein